MERGFINYYEILGLSRNYTLEELDRVCNKIEKEMKDYVATHALTQEQLDAIKEQHDLLEEAYYVLSSPRVKEKYDREYFDHLQKMMDHISDDAKSSYSIKSLDDDKDVVYRSSSGRGNYLGRRVAVKKGFLAKLKQSYREVREDEKRLSFVKRHQNIAKAFRTTFGDWADNLPKEIIYYTGAGTAHVFLEGFYHLHKLGGINKDTVSKYIIRNRGLIATALAAGIVASTGVLSKDDNTPVLPPVVETAISEDTFMPDEEYMPFVEPQVVRPTIDTPRVVLNRKYEIVRGDNLSTLALNANSTVKELKKINNYTKDVIYTGNKMIIPYTIEREDLEFYTEVVNAKGYTIIELARIYDTDPESIYKLNTESIIKSGDSYTILADSIVVPKFITKAELSELRRQKNFSNR